MAKMIKIGDKVVRLALCHVDREENHLFCDFRLESDDALSPSPEFLPRVVIQKRTSPELWSGIKDSSRNQIVVTLFSLLLTNWEKFKLFSSPDGSEDSDLLQTTFLQDLSRTGFYRVLLATMEWKKNYAPDEAFELVDR